LAEKENDTAVKVVGRRKTGHREREREEKKRSGLLIFIRRFLVAHMDWWEWTQNQPMDVLCDGNLKNCEGNFHCEFPLESTSTGRPVGFCWLRARERHAGHLPLLWAFHGFHAVCIPVL
jgi:hypothetical protein